MEVWGRKEGRQAGRQAGGRSHSAARKCVRGLQDGQTDGQMDRRKESKSPCCLKVEAQLLFIGCHPILKIMPVQSDRCKHDIRVVHISLCGLF